MADKKCNIVVKEETEGDVEKKRDFERERDRKGKIVVEEENDPKAKEDEDVAAAGKDDRNIVVVEKKLSEREFERERDRKDKRVVVEEDDRKAKEDEDGKAREEEAVVAAAELMLCGFSYVSLVADSRMLGWVRTFFLV